LGFGSVVDSLLVGTEDHAGLLAGHVLFFLLLFGRSNYGNFACFYGYGSFRGRLERIYRKTSAQYLGNQVGGHYFEWPFGIAGYIEKSLAFQVDLPRQGIERSGVTELAIWGKHNPAAVFQQNAPTVFLR